MTGPVTWEMVAVIAAVLGAVTGAWLRIEYRIEKLIGGVSTAAQAAHAHSTLVQSQLVEFKLHVSENYAKHDDVREMKDEIVGRLDHLSGRIDKAIDRAPAPTSHRRPA